ncbi:MAG TPA: carboxymuconolactone decarboxylase family protein [Dehalococcoidia bacterium]|nr:carboxymuconolactone decarboxylase family protein [Dehalococcoidia bacterium]
MPRVPAITAKEQLPEAQRPIFAAIAESRGAVGGPFPVLLNSPEVAGRVAHLGTYLRFESELSGVQRELAIITTAREWNCALEWGGHVQLARREGVREQAIDAVGRRAPLAGLTDEERLIVGYARELVGTRRVGADTFAAAHKALGDRGVTDLTATIGYYGMLACALNAFEVEPPAGAPPLP